MPPMSAPISFGSMSGCAKRLLGECIYIGSVLELNAGYYSDSEQ